MAEAVTVICGWCKKWLSGPKDGKRISHGMCPKCKAECFPEVKSTNPPKIPPINYGEGGLLRAWTAPEGVVPVPGAMIRAAPVEGAPKGSHGQAMVKVAGDYRLESTLSRGTILTAVGVFKKKPVRLLFDLEDDKGKRLLFMLVAQGYEPIADDDYPVRSDVIEEMLAPGRTYRESLKQSPDWRPDRLIPEDYYANPRRRGRR